MPDTAARLGSLISPLRRSLLRVARSSEHLPEIPDAQVELLRALPAGRESSPGELADELGLSRPTISNLLRDMERAKLVTRRGATDDRRRVVVAASDRALDLLARFDRASAAVLAEVLGRLSDDDRRALDAALPALERLRDAVEDVSHHRAEGGLR
ncbi:MarR family winged helix-turn-helix transcriptional regulator [Agromyces mariniharenae]|uniref:MarR family transcriptional regulator n=1 Tax=Agromyces mariniharenae TaxID=2604423 RepID=A0A5S4V6P9_9MICO|nr:MarR family transcriptional regulator [Agromyces mariniharenae]TYL53523.1 MarR family transcriptional regulator [Agromyces mariniharenae]